MADPKDDKKKDETHMGITFSEVHSDEPHETIDAHKAEVVSPKSSHTGHREGSDNVFDITRAFVDEHTEQGTIVSDRRHEGPTLGESLKDAWNEWWGKTKSKVTKTVESLPKPKEEPVVPKAETRVEVVKAAAEKANIAPKDDHRVVVEKIRTFKQDFEKVSGTPLIIKEPSREQSSWSHVNEEKPEIPTTPDVRGSVIAPEVKKNIVKPVVPPPAPPVASPAPSVKEHTFTPREPVKPAPPLKLATQFSVPPTVQKKEIEVPKPVNIPAPVHETKPMELPKQVEQKPAPTPPVSRPTPPPPPPAQPSAWRPSAAPKTPDVKPIPEPPKPVPPPVSRPTPPPPAPEKPAFIHEEIIVPPVPLTETSERVFTAPEPSLRSQEREAAPEPLAGYSAARTTPEEPPIPDVEEQFRGEALDPVMPRQLREEHAQRSSVPEEAPYTPSDATRHAIRWTAYILIVLLGVALAFFAVKLFNADEATTGENVTMTIPAFFSTGSQVPVPLSGDRSGFLHSLAEKVASAPSGVTQLYPLREGATLTAEEFFTFLGIGMRDASVRTLEDTFMLGSVTTVRNEPFIIIRSYNFDALFSGLLSWEETMQRDLEPLFGTPEAQPFFKDAVQNNKSIRILRDSTGSEVLLYSFINQNTVVITSSSEALSKILSQF